MGLAPAETETDQAILLLRLVMYKGGDPISHADLIIVPGQTAELTVPGVDGKELQYRVQTTDRSPGHLMLSAGVKHPNGDGELLAALSTQLHPERGKVVKAAEFITTSGDYELVVAFSDASLIGDVR